MRAFCRTVIGVWLANAVFISSWAFGFAISPGSMRLYTEWGSQDVLHETFSVKPYDTLEGVVRLGGPEDLWYSLAPNEEVRSMDATWDEGKTWYDYNLYIKEPTCWIPDKGKIRLTYGAGQKPPETGGIGAIIVVEGRIALQVSNAPEDTHTPSTDISSLNGRKDDGQVYRSDVEIELRATDDFSGVDSTFYRTSPAEEWQEGTTLTLKTPGERTVEYYSVDRAGNSEGAKKLQVDIEPTAKPPLLADTVVDLGPSNTADTEVADVNNDGLPDVIVCNTKSHDDPATQVFLNDGNGTFVDTGQSINTDSLDFGNSLNYDCTTGDLDNDGNVDLILANYQHKRYGGGLYLFQNDGTGHFSFEKRLSTSSAGSVACADVNGDGLADLIAGTMRNDLNNDPGLDLVFVNDSGFSFHRGSEFNQKDDRNRTFSVRCADLNSDGLRDVLTASGRYYKNRIRAFFNDGNGNFFDSDSCVLPGGGRKFEVIDVNGDGLMDVVSSEGIYLNRGDSFLRIREEMYGPVDVGDLNGDGIPDIVSGNNVMLGIGDGHFTTIETFQVADSYRLTDITLSDLNLDGDLDIIRGLRDGRADPFTPAPTEVYWNEGVVPEPATVVLLGLGLIPLAIGLKRDFRLSN